MRRICMNREFPPFFDQEEPQLPIIGQIAEFYLSDERSRFEACGVFKASSGILIVFVGGCSCWPTRGYTIQHHCLKKIDADRLLSGDWRPLLQSCQDKKWQPTTNLKEGI